jgi:hypothetical protein
VKSRSNNTWLALKRYEDELSLQGRKREFELLQQGRRRDPELSESLADRAMETRQAAEELQRQRDEKLAFE